MDFPTAIKTCLFKKYCCFEGRASRSEYWFFMLAAFLVEAVVSIIPPLLGLVWLVLFLPTLGVTVRRLHDTDRSGWWYLAILIPFGVLWLLYVFICKGTPAPNRFGPDPLVQQALEQA